MIKLLQTFCRLRFATAVVTAFDFADFILFRNIKAECYTSTKWHFLWVRVWAREKQINLSHIFCGCLVFGDTGYVCASKNHKRSDSKIDWYCNLNSGLVFSLLLSFQYSIYNLLMTRFEPQTSGVGSNRSTNWAMTTAQIVHDWCLGSI